LHRKPTDAPGFYAMYCGLIVVAAALVLIPGVPLGLLTNAVQTLAGILLPSAVVFLLILCNDKQVLGPWVNNRLTNMLAALIVAVLVVLSIILTSAVAFPGISGDTITGILVSGCLIGLIIAIAVNVLHAREEAEKAPRRHQSERAPSLKALYDFRMPPLEQLKPMLLSQRNKLWMAVLRIYLLVAMLMVVYSVIKAMW
jgi:hypothetical protein